MKPSCFCRIRSVWAGVAVATAVITFLGGCQNIFTARHKVLVDAIAAPEAEPPSGKSYRLVAKRSVVSAATVQVPVVKACVDAALAGQGMYEPPANVAPDMIIEVTYGRDASARVDPAARETFLQLSARSNPERALERATGPELWDVRVALLGVAGSIESAMPLLAAVAAMHVATNTGIETRVDVPQKSPMIEAVRLAAIQSLEAKAQTAAAPAAPPPPPPAPGTGSGGSSALGGASSATRTAANSASSGEASIAR